MTECGEHDDEIMNRGERGEREGRERGERGEREVDRENPETGAKPGDAMLPGMGYYHLFLLYILCTFFRTGLWYCKL